LAPTLKKERDGRVRIVPGKADAKKSARTETKKSANIAAKYAIWHRHGTEWRFNVQPAGEPLVTTDDADAVVVSAVDWLGNESPRAAVTLAKRKK
jgi:hypothetical protein